MVTFRHKRCSLVAAWVLALTAAANCCRTAEADTIMLRPAVRLDPGIRNVRLADIADLNGEGAHKLAEVAVTARSDGRDVQEIGVDEVRRVLSTAGADWTEVTLSGTVCVIRPNKSPGATGEAGSGREVVAAADRDLKFNAGENSATGTIGAALGKYISDEMLRIDAGDVEVAFEARDRGLLERSTLDLELEILPQGTLRSARATFILKLYAQGILLEQHRLTVQVRIQQPVLMLRVPVSRGGCITSEMIREEKRLLPPSTRPAIRRTAEVVGLEACSQLQAGQILREGDVASRVLVQRMDQVTLRARHGPLMIRMPGRATEAGRVGDVIKVKRLQDGLILEGRVESDGEVLIEQIPAEQETEK